MKSTHDRMNLVDTCYIRGVSNRVYNARMGTTRKNVQSFVL